MYLILPMLLSCTSPLEDPGEANDPPSGKLPPVTPRTPTPPASPSPGGVTGEGPTQSIPAGPADQDVIASIVRRHRDEVQTCVEVALRQEPNLRGRVSFGWSIENGAVSHVHLVTDTARDPELQSCILRVVERLKFDPAITAEVAEFPWLIEPPAKASG